jgi:hypothetical protein
MSKTKKAELMMVIYSCLMFYNLFMPEIALITRSSEVLKSAQLQ